MGVRVCASTARTGVAPASCGPRPGSHRSAAPPAPGGMIIFFPTYARRIPGERRWRATVAGMISRPLPPQSRRRTLAIGVIRRLLELDETQLQSEVFQRRADAFLFQRVAGEPVRIRIGDQLVQAGLSDRVGHFQRTIDLDEAQIDAVADPPGGGSRWLSYEAVREADGETAAWSGGSSSREGSEGGRIQLVDEAGLSVVSDIDDTVKVTNVANRRELLANTLLREFTAVDGMADVYRSWQREGAVFHYVSASPWQLARCLCGFLRDVDLPAGSMHLKLFRLKDSTPLGRLPSRKHSKRRIIEKIMADFPDRRFLLVGDSGERDPELYAAIARRHPRQVAAVAIRRVEARHPRRTIEDRVDRLARRLPAGTLRIFEQPPDLAKLVGSR